MTLDEYDRQVPGRCRRQLLFLAASRGHLAGIDLVAADVAERLRGEASQLGRFALSAPAHLSRCRCVDYVRHQDNGAFEAVKAGLRGRAFASREAYTDALSSGVSRQGRAEAAFAAEIVPPGDYDIRPYLTPLVVAVAEDIALTGSLAELPVLADALEDEGCVAGEVLAHLRSPGPHLAGCWALHLCLPKPILPAPPLPSCEYPPSWLITVRSIITPYGGPTWTHSSTTD